MQKKVSLLVSVLVAVLQLQAQTTPSTAIVVSSGPSSATPNTNPPNDDNFGWARRISFIVGAGPSILINKIYEDPTINKADNAVKIERASKLRANLSLGIVYTPYVSSITRTIPVIRNGVKKNTEIIEYYPRGITYALFINPIDLASINTTSNSSIDVGLGIGQRFGSFAYLLTAEFFSVRQPRDYFITQYGNNNTSFKVAENIQTSIDLNDGSIFKSRKVVGVGFKLAYTFDIVRSYYTQSSSK